MIPAAATVVLSFALASGCSPGASNGQGQVRAEPHTEVTEVVAEPAPAEPSRDCSNMGARIRERLAGVVAEHVACVFDVDCVEASVATGCTDGCPVGIHPSGLVAFEEAVAREARETCPAMTVAGCEPPDVECRPGTPRCDQGHCVHASGDAPIRDVPIPAENARGRADVPMPRPPLGDADERGRRLLDAIVAGDPRRAEDFFFPREAFAKVKAIVRPDDYWQRLVAFYREDIEILHRELAIPDGATVEYVGLELSHRGGWVRPREEANALPYHAARHNTLRFLVDGQPRTVEVRVLIHWGPRWYITHLREPR